MVKCASVINLNINKINNNMNEVTININSDESTNINGSEHSKSENNNIDSEYKLKN